MTRSDVMKDVRPLTDEEHDVWVEFVATHQKEMRCEMARALFDDVRPEWEDHLPNGGDAPPWTAVPVVWRTGVEAT